MKNLDLLKTHAAILSGEMDKISADISDLEGSLKKGCFPTFQYDMPMLELKITWGSSSKRLSYCSYDEKLYGPLIESPFEVRKKIYPHLDKFIVDLIEHAMGIQNPKLALTKGE